MLLHRGTGRALMASLTQPLHCRPAQTADAPVRNRTLFKSHTLRLSSASAEYSKPCGGTHAQSGGRQLGRALANGQAGSLTNGTRRSGQCGTIHQKRAH